MTKIQSWFINGLLADASYADNLFGLMSSADLNGALSVRMTQVLAKYISDNYKVVAHKESSDTLGSGFNATVWRGIDGGAFAGKVYVSLQGTAGLQDFLTDINLAQPFGNTRGQSQIVFH